MARKRMIDPGFWIDEKLGTISPLARLLFMGLISNSDDEGRLPGHPALIKSQVFPYDADITPEQVTQWLGQLEELEILIIYTVDNQTYIQIKNFLKHQTINRPTASKYPDPSLNTHGVLTDNSLPKEEKRREENIREVEEKRKEDILSSGDDSPTPYKQIVDLYNQYCASLPKAKTITDKRKKTLRSRWKTYKDISTYEKVFQMAQASDFLSGRNGKWTGCSFDWLITESNMIKVLEGNYENKEQPKQGLNKKMDFQKFPHHEYKESELEGLFEDVGGVK